MLKRALPLLTVVATVSSCTNLDNTATTATSTDRTVRNVLFVGNSFTYYNNSLHNHIKRLLRASHMSSRPKYRLRTMTISGSRLAEHLPAIPAIVGGSRWDVVVLQGHSRLAAEGKTADGFESAAVTCDRHIRRAGARTALFMTWAYQDQPQMIAAL